MTATRDFGKNWAAAGMAAEAKASDARSCDSRERAGHATALGTGANMASPA
ncbi:hypothetical protein IIC65_09530 [Candidatus Sumerlaeota bacterium]|nr:hypothetical protein [Candidatus Sumerlaeota bacterium]